MIASLLKLSRKDVKSLKIYDEYSLHRVVYSLYEDIRTEQEKTASVSSGILYADKGGDEYTRNILLLSNRAPREPMFGTIENKKLPNSFLEHDSYSFEVIVNPTRRDKNSGKLLAVCGDEAIRTWFIERAIKSWGFSVKSDSIQVSNTTVKTFTKKNHLITQGNASLKGELKVIDRIQFIQSFQLGIGRGRAFGCGLLQIVPLSNNINF